MLWNLSNFPRAAADRCWKAARTWNCCCCSTLLTILLPPPSQLLTTSSRHITSSSNSSSSKDDVDDPASARLRQKTFLKVTFSVGKILSQNRVYITFNTLHSLQGRQEKNMGLNQLAVAVCWCNHKSLQGTPLKVNVQCAKPILGPQNYCKYWMCGAGGLGQILALNSFPQGPIGSRACIVNRKQSITYCPCCQYQEKPNGCFPSLKRINAYLIRSSRNFGRRVNAFSSSYSSRAPSSSMSSSLAWPSLVLLLVWLDEERSHPSWRKSIHLVEKCKGTFRTPPFIKMQLQTQT